MKTLFASIGCCAMVGMVGFSPAQAQQEDRLVSLFAGLSQKGSVSAELEKQVVAAIDSIPAMTGEQVSMAIPAIMPAIRAGNERVQGLAALVCLAIVVRPDGTQLLQREFPVIASLFRFGSTRLDSVAGAILVNAKTTFGENVVSHVLFALNQQGRSAADRIPALLAAARLGPTDPAVVDSVTNFMLNPMDAATKVSALTTIRSSRIDGGPIRLQLISWLGDSDPGVKVGAISVLTRMGADAVNWAKFELERIAQRETEPQAVRAEAARALRTLQ